MTEALTTGILPIFAALAAGYIFFKLKLFDLPQAQSVNRFVYFFAAPALVFSIIAGAPIQQLNFPVLGLYFLAQGTVYLIVALVMLWFGYKKGEALLMGMTAAFVNHAFFVLPIAIQLYGDIAALPVAGVIFIDLTLVFCLSTFAFEFMQSDKPSPAHALHLIVKNPFIIALALGLAAIGLKPFVPQGILVYAKFAGSAAAPAALFALGAVLASQPLWPLSWPSWFIVGAKLLVHPVAFVAVTTPFTLPKDWYAMALMVAAGPCGAMPFTLAFQYGVRTDVIAKAVLISTLLSLLTLSVLTPSI